MEGKLLPRWAKRLDQRELRGLATLKRTDEFFDALTIRSASTPYRGLWRVSSQGVRTGDRIASTGAFIPEGPTYSNRHGKMAAKKAVRKPSQTAARVSAANQRDRKYMNALRREFRVLLCTKNKKYEKLRKRLTSSSTESTIVVVALIAAGLSGPAGVMAAASIPFVGTLLRALLKIGVEAFCAK